MQVDSIAPVESASIEFDGYVPVVIRVNGEFEWPPRYWRTGDFEKSLVEVGVDPNSGALCKVTVTSVDGLSNQPISPIGMVDSVPNGLPRAVLATWPDGQTRVDEQHELTASLVGNRLTVAFGEFDQPMTNSVRCDRVIFLIDESNTLRGIELHELTEGEIENFRYAVGLAK